MVNLWRENNILSKSLFLVAHIVTKAVGWSMQIRLIIFLSHKISSIANLGSPRYIRQNESGLWIIHFPYWIPFLREPTELPLPNYQANSVLNENPLSPGHSLSSNKFLSQFLQIIQISVDTSRSNTVVYDVMRGDGEMYVFPLYLGTDFPSSLLLFFFNRKQMSSRLKTFNGLKL